MKNSIARRNGRPSTQQLHDEVQRMSQLIARGATERDIRQRLRINRRGYRYRMRLLGKSASIDPGKLWTEFWTATHADLETLGEAETMARDDGDSRGITGAVLARDKLRHGIVEMAIDLGMIERPAEDGRLTLGDFFKDEDSVRKLFYRQDQDDSQLPHGNVYPAEPERG